MLKIQKIDGNNFRVYIDSKNRTIHEVFLSDKYWSELTQGKISKIKLIENSFIFLLEREPSTSILKHFKLQEIQNYFPYFEDEIKSK